MLLKDLRKCGPRQLVIAGSQVHGAKNSRKFDGIKQLFRDWHGIQIRFGILIEWTVIFAHLFLCPIAKYIFLRWHNRSTSILLFRKLDQPCCQELLAMSLNTNSLGNTKLVRSLENRMVVL